ncbi:MAG: putative capsid protein [Circular genetic element sp.]|nr:MAG: putative capsid protein [Circular genetic element sp.]
MARKSYTRKTSRGGKIQPAVQTMTFYVTVPPGSSTHFLDVNQVTSLLNRRFYRQGLNNALAGFKILSNPGFTGAAVISKLPNTWVMSNAWEKSFRTWTKMNSEALAETQSLRPKFLDFKIYADADHHNAGYGANLLPVSFAGFYVPGEWEPSKVTVPTQQSGFSPALVQTTDFELIATGSSFPGAGGSGLDAVSLIEGYAASRGLPNIADPNTPEDATDTNTVTPENWMTAIFNEGTDQTHEIIENMTRENDIAPYPFENGDNPAGGTFTDTMYPGGANQGTGLQIHDLEFITGTTIGGTTRLKGGNFPCGLVRFDFTNDTVDENILTLQIDLIPGYHRGYLCEPMTEM